MDSDPEPRSTPSSPTLAAAQSDDSPEEPPSPWSSAAIVLGPLIAVLTLIVPLGSVVADRLSAGPVLAPDPERMGGWPSLREPRAPRAAHVGLGAAGAGAVGTVGR